VSPHHQGSLARPLSVQTERAPTGTGSWSTGRLSSSGAGSDGRASKPNEVDDLGVHAEPVDHATGTADLVECSNLAADGDHATTSEHADRGAVRAEGFAQGILEPGAQLPDRAATWTHRPSHSRTAFPTDGSRV
jgi:hypothetical protein